MGDFGYENMGRMSNESEVFTMGTLMCLTHLSIVYKPPFIMRIPQFPYIQAPIRIVSSQMSNESRSSIYQLS